MAKSDLSVRNEQEKYKGKSVKRAESAKKSLGERRERPKHTSKVRQTQTDTDRPRERERERKRKTAQIQ